MPTRLNAILLIPVLVGLVLGGLRVQESVRTWNEAEDARHVAELVEAAANYGHALMDERDGTVRPLLAGERDAAKVQKLRSVTDEAKTKFDEKAKELPETPALQRRMDAFRKVEPKLAELRQNAFSEDTKGVQTEEAYVDVQHPLMEFANELGLGTGNVTSYGRAVYAISLTKSAESLQRAIGMRLMVEPGPSAKDEEKQLTAFSSYAYLEKVALHEYVSGARPEDVKLLKASMREVEERAKEQAAGAKADAQANDEPYVAAPTPDKMVTAIGSGADEEALAAKGITPDSWFAAATGKFDAYRTVESQLTNEAVQEAERIASDAKRDTFLNAAIVLAALLVAFLLAGMMARSMGRAMRSLRTAALDVAEQRLPMLVDQLSRTEPGRVNTRVEPIPLDSRDELGEVARAFDQVHREAVRLASEQALLRGNVNAIFTNLSSRNQGLIERQLALITDLENNEADPDQLENLFRMDHLATRMRRNGENLLVLAGEEVGRRWSEPVPLVDILRAASSEVEHYERISLTGVPETEIHGAAVNDLVHLLAELLENATSFSSPQSNVTVAATRLPDGRIMIEIHDKGIGLTAEDFADLNHKLANPPTVDATISRRMGLFVVGRLANRHGIRVQLRPSGEQAGTTSLVMLPEVITHGGNAEEITEEDFTVSRIVQDQTPAPQPVFDNHWPSAADLGFDDFRYESPGAPGAESQHDGHDSVERSLWLDERRAALEAQQYGEAFPQSRPAPESTYAQGYPQGYPAEPGTHQGHDAASSPGGGPRGDGNDPMSVPGQPHYDSGAGREHQHPDRADPSSTVGFGGEQTPGTLAGSGPSPSGYHSTTDAGLPRRSTGGSFPEASGTVPEPYPEQTHSLPDVSQAAQEQPQQASDQRVDEPYGVPEPEPGNSSWGSVNDERWDRAGRLRNPEADGVTGSGLPRRVPRANLVDGSAEQAPEGGPQLSRAPEDVRGRLSNLHRGVRRGRSTGGSGTENDSPGFGPGSTYDQER
ncbi:ATPase [Streptomyces oceani]|uniref:histidine kinase n=1 Tax=Streptomyces oceani TaxID=1075402 RepID=A0A1E7KQF3_9ACTN|nr:ATPase [Streptomyces oceani]